MNLQNNAIFGQDLVLPKPENTTRFTSQNINGFRRPHEFQDVLEIAQALKDASVDIWNVQETNINWRSACLSQCYDRIRRVYKHARLSTSSSKITYRKDYQPGGTMSAVTVDYVRRNFETGNDFKMCSTSFHRPDTYTHLMLANNSTH